MPTVTVSVVDESGTTMPVTVAALTNPSNQSTNPFGLKFTPAGTPPWSAEVGKTYTVTVTGTDSSSLFYFEPIEYTVMPIPIDDCAALDL